MSSSRTAHRGPPISARHEVRGTFGSAEAMQEAIRRLEGSGFDRADLSLPGLGVGSAPDSGAEPADTEEDARQARTLHTSGAAAVAALAAAGITIGTGGAAAPAVAAAVIAGAAAGGATYAASSAANDSEQQDREVKAALGALILEVRAPTAAKRADAAAIMRAAGASDIVTVD